jgi:hypothetical protein
LSSLGSCRIFSLQFDPRQAFVDLHHYAVHRFHPWISRGE